ncbi:hypothetical protein CTAM01_13291 [Colletotrichum tamarilloi]|uniref:C2H2-type domain-containing protein n=1 Tax=Colletotrichum tamarilloi TaxID=1209934 RepID=A0ABQ9QSG9_9PEZI|nr:uncharacterized protein CTAM01_13291 [Colletotrichum tamarilloi]KAK1483671.1 hypothetical protein CTAM01_13291 [Colletotrichum tamarilloi]
MVKTYLPPGDRAMLSWDTSCRYSKEIDHETAHVTCYYGYCSLQFQNGNLRKIHEQTEHFGGSFMCTFANSLMGMHSNGEHAKHHTVLAVDSPRSTGYLCSKASAMNGKTCNTSYTSKQGTNYQNHL